MPIAVAATITSTAPQPNEKLRMAGVQSTPTPTEATGQFLPPQINPLGIMGN